MSSEFMPYVSRLAHRASRLTYQASRRIDAGVLLAALLTLFIIQSLLQPGLPTLADLPIHLYRTLEYGQAWSPGVLVPRWAPNLAYGYGYPLFIFAPPLPYWLGLAFQAVGLTLETSLKSLIILTILLYAIGMYLLGRDLLGSVEAGLIAATAYAFAPFALREALLYGGNIPQFLAIALFPWTLWAMTRAAQARSWGWGILAACFYAGILLSHLFQALIFTPVVGLFSFIFFRQLGVSSREPEQQSNHSLSVPGREFAIHNSEPKAPCGQFTIHNFYFPSPYALITIPLGLLLSA
ncbi:MAG TPA: 6-pyruvoyl-tetrahydropterin synthase-related protein, partial [Anaerolineae bacterium]|nr:6-pyruvoyl-tetrahydropterin synthase-related protein [Anaerolineae bacterium]